MQVTRTDKAAILGVRRCDDGTLRGHAVVARSGILVYNEGGKTIRELVRPETLSKNDSMESLKLRPITNDHPSAKLITPQNVKSYQVGMTGETVNCDGQTLYSSVVINEQGAVSAVSAGKRELSCGYTCDLVDGAGVWMGQRYDREQVNRKYNHVAICDLGRAGAIASLHLDAAAYAEKISILHLDAEDVFEIEGPEIESESGFGADGWKKPLGKLFDGCELFLVDSDYVKKYFDREFKGGHSWAPGYEYIGSKEKSEIWSPLNDSIDSSKSVASHLITEYLSMRYAGLDHDKAHAESSTIEELLGKISPLQSAVKGDNADNNSQGRTPMKVSIRVDGLDYPDQAPEVQKHIEKLDAQIAKITAEATAKEKDLQTKLDAQVATTAAIQAKLDSANAEIAALPEKIKAAGKARADLVAEVTPHLDAETVSKIDSMTDVDIRRAVAIKALPTVKEAIEKADEAAVGIYYTSAKAVLSGSTRFDAAAASNREKVNGKPKNDGSHAEPDGDEKKSMTQEKYDEAVCNAHKKTNRDKYLK